MYNNMGMAVKVLGCLALPGRCEQDGERSTGGDPDDTSYFGKLPTVPQLSDVQQRHE